MGTTNLAFLLEQFHPFGKKQSMVSQLFPENSHPLRPRRHVEGPGPPASGNSIVCSVFSPATTRSRLSTRPVLAGHPRELTPTDSRREHHLSLAPGKEHRLPGEPFRSGLTASSVSKNYPSPSPRQGKAHSPGVTPEPMEQARKPAHMDLSPCESHKHRCDPGRSPRVPRRTGPLQSTQKISPV